MHCDNFFCIANDSSLKEESPLVLKARLLKRKFATLLITVQHQHNKSINLEELKVLVNSLLIDKQENSQRIATQQYCDDVEQLASLNDILLYLIKKKFIGYQNYLLLEDIIKCLCRDDPEIVSQMDEYIANIKEFEEEISLSKQEELSHDEDLRPRTPAGLHEISYETSCDTNVHQWRDRMSRKFSWFKHTLLKRLTPGSIVLTYAVLPCVRSAVLRDLTNPVILKELESIGVTVISLPPSEKIEVPIPVVQCPEQDDLLTKSSNITNTSLNIQGKLFADSYIYVYKIL